MNNDLQNIMIVENPVLPDEVIKAYKDHKLVLFVGAGMSRLMGCQGWEQMANDLIKCVCTLAEAEQIINSSLDSKARITIASRKAKKIGKEVEFWETFKKAITPKEQPEYDIYKTILKLGGTIITTNCDNLLTRHMPYAFTTSCTPDELEKNKDKDFVYCIHGHYGEGSPVEQATLVFTMEKYLEKYTNGSDLLVFLQKIMHENTVLFLGYGLNEFEITSNAFTSRDRIEIKHYSLEGFFSYQRELAEAQAEYYASQGVQLIAYSKDTNEYHQQRNVIENWVEQLKEQTPYRSRNMLKVADAIRECSKANRRVVLNQLNMDDKDRDKKVKAILEAVHRSEDCIKWLIFLIDKDIVNPEMLAKKGKGKQTRIDIVANYLFCVIECNLNTASTEQRNVLSDFVKVCTIIVAQNSKLLNNYKLVTALSEASVLFDLLMDGSAWSIVDKWMERSFDNGLFWIEDNMKCISVLPEASQIKLLSRAYSFQKEDRDKDYWIERLTKTASKQCGQSITKEIAKSIFDNINERTDEGIRYYSLEDRFQFSYAGYEKALIDALSAFTLMQEVPEKEELITHFFKKASSAIGYQTVFSLSRKCGIYVIDIVDMNPLKGANDYVDFYLWLNDGIDLLKEDDIIAIDGWITEADFGYEYTSDEDRNKRISEIIATNKYQAYGILAMRDSKYKEKQESLETTADTSKETPVENMESYYAIRTIGNETHFNNGISNRLGGKELLAMVEEEVSKSSWGNSDFSWREVQRSLFNTVTDEQLQEYIMEMLSQPTNLLLLALNELTVSQLLKRSEKEYVEELIQTIKAKINNAEKEDNIIHDIGAYLVRLMSELDKNGWTNEEVFEIVMDIDVSKILIDERDLNYEWSLLTNILNKDVCIYYETVINNACRSDFNNVSERFKTWFDTEIDGEGKKLLLLTCAYYYSALKAFDKKWTAQELSQFENTDYDVELALSLCSGMTYIDKDVIAFITKDNRLTKVIKATQKHDAFFSEVVERFVTYITAARFFEYISDVTFEAFLRPLSDQQIGKVYSAVTTGISTEDEKKRARFLQEIYMKIKRIKDPEVAASIVYFIYKLNSVTSSQWEIIEDAIDCVACDRRTWGSIEMCLRKTRIKSKQLESVIEKLVIKTEILESYDWYLIDKILEQLSRVNSEESIRRVARFALDHDFSPTKYGRIEDNPSDTITYIS